MIKGTLLFMRITGIGRSEKTKAVTWEFLFNRFCIFGPPGTFITKRARYFGMCSHSTIH